MFLKMGTMSITSALSVVVDLKKIVQQTSLSGEKKITNLNIMK